MMLPLTLKRQDLLPKFFFKLLFWSTSRYGVGTGAGTGTVLHSYSSATLAVSSLFHSGNLSTGRDLLDSLESAPAGKSSDCQETPKSLEEK
jgi:hypothetical protein